VRVPGLAWPLPSGLLGWQVSRVKRRAAGAPLRPEGTARTMRGVPRSPAGIRESRLDGGRRGQASVPEEPGCAGGRDGGRLRDRQGRSRWLPGIGLRGMRPGLAACARELISARSSLGRGRASRISRANAGICPSRYLVLEGATGRPPDGQATPGLRRLRHVATVLSPPPLPVAAGRSPACVRVLPRRTLARSALTAPADQLAGPGARVPERAGGGFRRPLFPAASIDSCARPGKPPHLAISRRSFY
jgi:hypothetical protein